MIKVAFFATYVVAQKKKDFDFWWPEGYLSLLPFTFFSRKNSGGRGKCLRFCKTCDFYFEWKYKSSHNNFLKTFVLLKKFLGKSTFLSLVDAWYKKFDHSKKVLLRNNCYYPRRGKLLHFNFIYELYIGRFYHCLD